MDTVSDRTQEGTQEVTAESAGGPAVSTVPLTGAITVDAARVREHVNAMVRDSVEQTLNALLDEADRVCRATPRELMNGVAFGELTSPVRN